MISGKKRYFKERKVKRSKTVPQLKKEVWNIFSKYIRLRDCLVTTRTRIRGCCITCGVELPIDKLQAGHFIQGRNNSILFDEESVHAQCALCNIYKHGNQLAYRRAILDLYGKGYDLVLEKRSREYKKFTPQELIELKIELLKKIESFEGGE